MDALNQLSQTGLVVEKLTKTFERGSVALKQADFSVDPGQMVALIGASGSGKSTLLRHLSGFVAADAGSGSIRVGHHLIQSNGQIDRKIRSMRSDIGFIFQQFNLVGRMSVLTNVLTGLLPRVPLWRSLFGLFTQAEKLEAYEALKVIGIEHLAYQRASTLSGGQQQRVAIARAYVSRPSILIADEPTGNLDPATSVGIMKLLDRINREGTTVVMATHDSKIVDSMRKRVIELENGHVIRDQVRGVYGYAG